MNKPFVIKQGESWGQEWALADPVTGLPMDLSGWIVRGAVRAVVESATVLHEWSSVTGNAAIVDNKVRILVAPAVSSGWTWYEGTYDIEAVSPLGDVVSVSEGSIYVKREATR